MIYSLCSLNKTLNMKYNDLPYSVLENLALPINSNWLVFSYILSNLVMWLCKMFYKFNIIIGIGCEMRLHKQLNLKQVYTKLGSVKDYFVIHVSITFPTRT